MISGNKIKWHLKWSKFINLISILSYNIMKMRTVTNTPMMNSQTMMMIKKAQIKTGQRDVSLNK